MVVPVAAESMEMAAIQIRADYDEEAHVWVAQSDEIPLVTEAATFEVLCQKLPSLILDVLGENDGARAGKDVLFELIKSDDRTLLIQGIDQGPFAGAKGARCRACFTVESRYDAFAGRLGVPT
jgi:hypothetical protein